MDRVVVGFITHCGLGTEVSHLYTYGLHWSKVWSLRLLVYKVLSETTLLKELQLLWCNTEDINPHRSLHYHAIFWRNDQTTWQTSNHKINLLPNLVIAYFFTYEMWKAVHFPRESWSMPPSLVRFYDDTMIIIFPRNVSFGEYYVCQRNLKNKKFHLDLKWPEMRSKVIIGHPKAILSIIF